MKEKEKKESEEDKSGFHSTETAYHIVIRVFLILVFLLLLNLQPKHPSC